MSVTGQSTELKCDGCGTSMGEREHAECQGCIDKSVEIARKEGYQQGYDDAKEEEAVPTA